MSLLQRALDRAENPELDKPEAAALNVQPKITAEVKSVPAALPPRAAAVISPEKVKCPEPQHEQPRLNAVRYYEKENQKVEEAIQEKLRETLKNKSLPALQTKKEPKSYVLTLILILLFVSLGASLMLFSDSKTFIPETQIIVPERAEIPKAVVVKTENPLKSKSAAQVKFLLTGITASGGTNLAVINNQVVGTGDTLREGAAVKSIQADRVVLELDGKQIVLNF